MRPFRVLAVGEGLGRDQIAAALRDALTRRYRCCRAASVKRVSAARVDLAIFAASAHDETLAEIRCVRGAGLRVRVLVVVSRLNAAVERYLDAGADAVLQAPFSTAELSAWIRALLRRPDDLLPNKKCLGDIELDLVRRTAAQHGETIELTHLEFRLLERLALRHGSLCTRSELLGSLWNYKELPSSNALDAVVARLRRKLRDSRKHVLIKTIHGEGFVLEAG